MNAGRPGGRSVSSCAGIPPVVVSTGRCNVAPRPGACACHEALVSTRPRQKTMRPVEPMARCTGPAPQARMRASSCGLSNRMDSRCETTPVRVLQQRPFEGPFLTVAAHPRRDRLPVGEYVWRKLLVADQSPERAPCLVVNCEPLVKCRKWLNAWSAIN